MVEAIMDEERSREREMESTRIDDSFEKLAGKGKRRGEGSRQGE